MVRDDSEMFPTNDRQICWKGPIKDFKAANFADVFIDASILKFHGGGPHYFRYSCTVKTI